MSFVSPDQPSPLAKNERCFHAVHMCEEHVFEFTVVFLPAQVSVAVRSATLQMTP